MKSLYVDFDEDKIISNLEDVVPLFPLGNMVFFPNTVIPLHIFEERYKQMIDDSVSSHNLICMTLMQDDMKDDDLAISKIGCVGRIISNEEGEEGKKNIILYGITRIHIDEIIYSKPYRQAKINIIKSKKTSDNDPLYKRITDLVGEWNLLLEDYNDNYKIKVDQNSTLSKLTDSLSSIIVSSPSERQYLLEELDEGKRAVRIIEVLESRIDYLIGKLEIPDKDSTSIN